MITVGREEIEVTEYGIVSLEDLAVGDVVFNGKHNKGLRECMEELVISRLDNSAVVLVRGWEGDSNSSNLDNGFCFDLIKKFMYLSDFDDRMFLEDYKKGSEEYDGVDGIMKEAEL